MASSCDRSMGSEQLPAIKPPCHVASTENRGRTKLTNILTPAFRMRPLKPLILLAALVCAVVLWQRQAPTGSPPPQTETATPSLPAFLPPEAHTTLDLIAHGGP